MKVFGFFKKHIKLIIFLIILIIVGIVALNFWKKKQAQAAMENVMNVATETIERQDIQNYVSMTGTIEANDSQTVYANLSEVEVLEVRVEVGDYVNKGDVVAVLDSSSLEESLASAEKQLSVQQAKTALSQQQAQRKLADTNYDAANNVGDAQTDLVHAQTDYGYTVGDSTDAYNDWQDALADYNEAEDDYGDAKEKLNKIKSKHDRAVKVDGTWYSYDGTPQPENKNGNNEDVTGDYKALKSVVNQLESARDSAESQATSKERAYYNSKESVEKSYRNVTSAEEKVSDTLVSEGRKILDAEDNVTSTNLDASIATDSLEEKISDYKKEIEKCLVTAPLSGVITSVSMEMGDQVDKDNNTICVIQDTSGYLVKGTVDEYDISTITEGMKAVIKTEATGDEEMTGVVTFVSPTPQTSSSSGTASASSSSSSVVYPIKVTLDNMLDSARIGMTAETNIILDSAENVLTVPYDCVTQNDKGEDCIYVLEGGPDSATKAPEESAEGDSKAGKRTGGGFGMGGGRPDFGSAGANFSVNEIPSNAKEIVVKIGLKTDYYTEISSDEIKEGMTVVVVSSSDEDDSSDSGFGMGGGPGGPGGF